MFRQLNEAQERQFREWARDNYNPGGPISKLWHPVIQDECERMNAEELANADLD